MIYLFFFFGITTIRRKHTQSWLLASNHTAAYLIHTWKGLNIKSKTPICLIKTKLNIHGALISMVWFLSENSDLKRKRSKIKKIKLIDRRLNMEAAVNVYNSPKMKYIFLESTHRVHRDNNCDMLRICLLPNHRQTPSYHHHYHYWCDMTFTQCRRALQPTPLIKMLW